MSYVTVKVEIIFQDGRDSEKWEFETETRDIAEKLISRIGYGWGSPDNVSVKWEMYEKGAGGEESGLVDSGQYGWVQELAPPGFVQAVPVTQHGDRDLPEGIVAGSISQETFPWTIKALNLIRADSGGPSWPPQSMVTIPARWISYMSRIEQGLSSLREDAPAPEDPDACDRWKKETGSYLDSEFYSFCVPQDDVGEQMTARSNDLWLAAQFLEDFFDGWLSYEDEGFDNRIQEMMP